MIYEISGLRFRYPGMEREVLSGLDLEIHRGDILSVLGPNGAGKSTLLGCMMNLNRHFSGRIAVDGKSISEIGVRELAEKVSFVPQTVRPVFGYTVLSFVTMGRAPMISALGRPGEKDLSAARDALEKMGIGHLAERPLTEVSGGELQQAVIARAVVRRPQVILFDEPTAHLDFGNQLRTLRVIKRLSSEGYTTVITTHDPDHAIMLDGRTALLDRNGALISGTVDEIVTEENLRRIYNTEILIRYNQEVGRRVCLYPEL